ncbi:hypothetical protein D3C78_1313480 [compost metagenome]
MVAARARERVVHAGVHIELHARLAAQRREDALARLGRTEAVLLGDVQHQAAAQVGGLFQAAFDAHAVVAHGHVHIGAAGGQIGQLAAQAIAQHAHPALLLGQPAQHGDRGRDVLQAQLHVETLVELERARHVSRAVGQLNAGLLAPEQVGHHHHVTLFGQQLRRAAHEIVDAEDLLAQHQAGAVARSRHGHVGAEGLAIVRGDRDLARRDVQGHAVLL